ncbi:hypothetical protein EX30DRAFT_202336 [Ascodesmis nigricans]|uniref:Uncharacterized protein n=1 Tax=Ascodesmis nigricans TaxID=341454 RepID=A0A4S2MK53_9PEZI|nr:hypothetical protein EX30DRAFT_202336 [Ascodesmis nigricans]
MFDQWVGQRQSSVPSPTTTACLVLILILLPVIIPSPSAPPLRTPTSEPLLFLHSPILPPLPSAAPPFIQQHPRCLPSYITPRFILPPPRTASPNLQNHRHLRITTTSTSHQEALTIHLRRHPPSPR